MVSTPIDSVACTELYLIVDPVAYNQLSLFIFIQNYTHLVAYLTLCYCLEGTACQGGISSTWMKHEVGVSFPEYSITAARIRVKAACMVSELGNPELQGVRIATPEYWDQY